MFATLVKQGEMMAVVHATGMNTFYGSAAKTVAETQKKSHIHIVLKVVFPSTPLFHHSINCVLCVLVG